MSLELWVVSSHFASLARGKTGSGTADIVSFEGPEGISFCAFFDVQDGNDDYDEPIRTGGLGECVSPG